MDFQYIVHGRNIVESQRGRDTRRTKNQNFMSYIKNVFPVHAIISENLNKIAGYDILRLFIARNKISELAAKNIEEEISLWCKQLRLDENKIWNPDEKI